VIFECVGICGLLFTFKYYSTYLDTRSKNKAQESISKHPKSEYVVIREGCKSTISEDELLVGDLIYLKIGMKVPVDGLMVKGHTM
jgi:Cu+-exporting ATPase